MNINDMTLWRVQSPESMGFHSVITPDTAACQVAQMFRLNLPKGASYHLQDDERELNAVLVQGRAVIEHDVLGKVQMEKLDSFYIPAKHSLQITALEECIFYIAGALFDGIGEPLVRKFDRSLPIGDIHQIHGDGPCRREVMFTLAPTDKASRLICGLTWGGDGSWTSWPPHQHEKYLEEVYCYFDMPKPKFGFHISYKNSGDVDDMVVHPVYSGTMVQAPCGYHPTVGCPGSQNAYFWVLAAFDPMVRKYDLAESDPMRV